MDANNLVLRPIEKMMDRIAIIRVNPLQAIRLQEELTRRQVNERLKNTQQPKARSKKLPRAKDIYTFLKDRLKPKADSKEMPMETLVLEQTIVKIGTLMALGFGEAGANIIAKNLETSQDVDPMIPGQKVTAIFGFCDIRNFTDATEVLREKVMMFVNQIAEIVHGVVDDFSGSANKNIGDAFLIVWKFPEKHPYTGADVAHRILEDGETKEITDPGIIAKTADLSLVSYLKIIALLNKSPIINEYHNHEGLRRRLGRSYRVKMGFGLHVGWAIEGAIGSMHKIDASYLSPNVNMASRLEAATKQFGVPILVSGPLVDLLSPTVKNQVRQIDCVKVKGSNEPLNLFTIDLDVEKLQVEAANTLSQSMGMTMTARRAERHQVQQSLKKLNAQSRKRAFKRQLWNPKFQYGNFQNSQNPNSIVQVANYNQVSSFFTDDPDIIIMRQHVPPDFNQSFSIITALKSRALAFCISNAFKAYIDGFWDEAELMLESLKFQLGPEDGPSIVLLQHMEEYDFKAPPDWKGCRSLTEK